VQRGGCGGVRRRAGLQRCERGHAGDSARAPPQRQLRERLDRRLGRQRRPIRQEAGHGPTVAVEVGGVKPSQSDLSGGWKRWKLLLFRFKLFFPIIILSTLILSREARTERIVGGGCH
jgi:hypothetical protein